MSDAPAPHILVKSLPKPDRRAIRPHRQRTWARKGAVLSVDYGPAVYGFVVSAFGVQVAASVYVKELVYARRKR